MESATTATSRPACAGSSRARPAAKEISTKANSPPWASAKEKREASGVHMPKSRASRKSTASFTSDEAEDEAEDQQRLAEEQREVDARAHRDEEHGEQQALEGLEVHLELVAVFALGQHHAGEEGAECRREADELHQQRDADHHDEREADEDLAHAGVGDEAEQRPREEAAGQHDDGDGGEHGQGLRPAGQIADQRGVMRVMRLRRGEQRQQGEDGDDRDVLEQQHREAGLAGGGLEEAALVEALQHDGRRRHGEDEAGGERRLPAEAQASAPPPSAAAVTTTCSPPSPMIGRRSSQSFEGCSSRPTRKSITTTPNSAKCMTSSPSWPTRPRSDGPMTMPATR